jgi:E3 ubiquitin-protein ligase UBR2
MILDNPSDGPCIFDWDCFGVLVPLTLSLPSLFLSDQPTPIPCGNTQELYTLKLILLSHIVKILLTADFNEVIVPMDVDEEDSVTKSNILELLSTVRKVASVTDGENAAHLDGHGIWTQVRI